MDTYDEDDFYDEADDYDDHDICDGCEEYEESCICDEPDIMTEMYVF